MPGNYEWDSFWLSLAIQVAALSKDPSTQVGALVVTSDNRQCSLGYNGFPAGVEETAERWERPEKYEWVIHAEKNAIANCPFDTKGCSLYCTHQPCHACLGFIANAGITKIMYLQPYTNLKRKDVWDELAKQFHTIGAIREVYPDEL